MQQKIDREIERETIQYDTMETNLKVEILKLSQSILEIDAALKQLHPNRTMNLNHYRQLLKYREDLDAARTIPEKKLVVQLTELTTLTENLLIGDVHCTLDAALPPSLATCMVPWVKYQLFYFYFFNTVQL